MNKRKVLVSAILAIALCVSLISGATFALFTSKSEVNIAVTSGKVDVKAVVEGLATSHQEADSAEASGYKTVEGSLYSGAAELDADAQTLTVSNLLPMDKISFNIKVTNESNVKIQYRTVIKAVEDDGLFAGLKIKVGEQEFNGTTVKTEYVQYAVGEGNQTIAVSIELPQDAGNDYQGKTCKLQYAVEAYQGNAQTPMVEETKIVATNDDDQTVVETKIESTSAQVAATIPAGVQLAENVKEIELKVSKANAPSTISVESEGEKIETFEIKMEGLAENNDTPITVTLNVSAGLTTFKLYHNSTLMSSKASLDEVVADQDYYYDIETGVLTFKSATFSPFTIVSNEEWKNVSSFTELAEAKKAAVANTTTYIKLTNNIDATAIGMIQNEGNHIILDMNGHTVTLAENNYLLVKGGTLELIGNGTISSPSGDTPAVYVVGSSDPAAENYTKFVVGENVTIEAFNCVGISYTDNASQEYGVKLIVEGTLLGRNRCINLDYEFVKTEGNVPEITCTETSVLKTESSGIYAAGYAIWNLAGDIITESIQAPETTSEGYDVSGNALIFKSGIVNITGGTYKSTDAKNDPAEGPQGVNKNSGAAICLVSDEVDNCPKILKVTISGGTFISEQSYGILECISKTTGGIYDSTKIYGNNMDAAASYTELTITGGTFKGAAGAIKINDMSNKKVVSGGMFISDPSLYLVEGKNVVVENGYYIVK